MRYLVDIFNVVSIVMFVCSASTKPVELAVVGYVESVCVCTQFEFLHIHDAIGMSSLNTVCKVVRWGRLACRTTSNRYKTVL